ncbi:class I SAM-dependent methyltransferase [Candidatus Saccharibacteria bacterium]|nr:MAG: class I SAM-dependent methyltransferase [Candidatus Saccharibacteria bacterium]
MVNDYDAYAAERQEELKKGLKLPHRYVEKPAMKSLLPDLRGKEVLLLGCGTGEETMMLEEFGAASMIGVDLSEGSVRLARETYPAHSFQTMDMHSLDFPDESFDFVYSSLTIHYSPEPLKVYGGYFAS